MKARRIFAVLGIAVALSASDVSGQTTATKQQELAAHKTKAQQFLYANKPLEAIPELQAVVALDPKDVDSQGNLGVLLFFQGQYVKATPHLRAAVKLQPNLWKIQALLGISEKRTGEMSNALADLEKAFPNLGEPKVKQDAGLELVELYTASNHLEKAAEVIDTLREADPTNPKLLYTAYRIHSDLAHEALLAMGVTAANSAQLHQAMAHELAKQGNNAAAIANYREAIKIDPSTPGLYFELAELLNATDPVANQEEVEKAYRAALKSNPYDVRAECRLGAITSKRGDTKEALAHYSLALDMQPNDAEANAGMARVLTSTEQSEKALPYLEKAVQADPTNSTYHFQLGTLYRKLGRAEDAKREMDLYQKYKDIGEKLRGIYRDLRQESPDAEPAESKEKP